MFFRTLLVALFLPSLAFAQPAQGGYADLVEKLSPAVVNISTTQKVKTNGVQMFGAPLDQLPNSPDLAPFKEFLEQFQGMQQRGDGKPVEREVTSLGSGFVIDAGGYIIANYHVIAEADEISVRFNDNTRLKATIVGRDKKTDLALLKVKSEKSLPFVPLGNSDAARVGDAVIAIGNPFGLGGTVTSGIISARGRAIGAGPFDDFIQTDASINRGNSGGPLFNIQGEVIGINSAIFSTTGGSIGIGFAIPTNLAKPVIEQLKQFGRTHRGWLGVKIQEVSDEVADSLGMKAPKGALVADVTKDSPAAKAGIQPGDIVTGFDGKDVSEMRFLPRLVAETPVGKTVKISIWRKGKAQDLNLVIAELNESEEADTAGAAPKAPDAAEPKLNAQKVLGLEIVSITPELRKGFSLDAAAAGVLVVGADGESEAAKRGIARGDVISEVNNEKVKDVDGFKRAIEAAKKSGRKFALVKIQRKSEAAFATLPLSEKK